METQAAAMEVDGGLESREIDVLPVGEDSRCQIFLDGLCLGGFLRAFPQAPPPQEQIPGHVHQRPDLSIRLQTC